MSFLQADEDRARALLQRRMRGAGPEEIAAWLALEPRAWVMRHGSSLYQAGLSAQDAADLYRRLGPQVAQSLARLIDQGRMADIDIRHVHFWAASGLLKPTYSAHSTGRRGEPNFTRWITKAREYIKACGGDQRLAALAAAAGLSVTETARGYRSDELRAETLEILVGLRQGSSPDPTD